MLELDEVLLEAVREDVDFRRPVAVAEAFESPTSSDCAVTKSLVCCPISFATVFALPLMITVPPRIVASSIVTRASNDRVR